VKFVFCVVLQDAADEDYTPEAGSTRCHRRRRARSLSPDDGDDLDDGGADEESSSSSGSGSGSESESHKGEPQPRARGNHHPGQRASSRGRREGEFVGGWMDDAATTAGIVGSGAPLSLGLANWGCGTEF